MKLKVNSERWLDPRNLKGECWKGVSFLPAEIKVSNRGRVRKKVGIGRYKILYAVDNGRQYYAVSISHKKYYIHRLVATAFVDNPNHNPEIDHINRDKADNRPCNLRWVTRKMNMANPRTLEARRRLYQTYQISVEKVNWITDKVEMVFPSIKSASEYVGISKNTMARWTKRRQIDGFYFYRRAI